MADRERWLLKYGISNFGSFTEKSRTVSSSYQHFESCKIWPCNWEIIMLLMYVYINMNTIYNISVRKDWFFHTQSNHFVPLKFWYFVLCLHDSPLCEQMISKVRQTSISKYSQPSYISTDLSLLFWWNSLLYPESKKIDILSLEISLKQEHKRKYFGHIIMKYQCKHRIISNNCIQYISFLLPIFSLKFLRMP